MTTSDLIWSIDVGIFTCFTSSLRLAVQKDCRASFGVADKVNELDEAPDDELDPEYPLDRLVSRELSQ